MAASLASKSQNLPSLPDRRSSLSSARTSHRSSNSYSHTYSHSKAASYSSVGAQSAPSSNRSSQRLQPPPEDAPVRRGPRLRSQYPLDSPEPHVEYILVAAFDIDKGPIMEHQYPGAISPDENMLAELMLPDQTHMRKQDWTMFFLHKDSPSPEDEDVDVEAEERRQRRRERIAAREQQRAEGIESDPDASSEEESSSDDESETESPSLMYVLNLVTTKQDSTVRRGAVVKAMAVCTRHSFLHIYKPLLLLALEDYFKSPTQETLEELYNSLNAMDLSLMPRLSLLERHVLQANDVRDLFVEKYERMLGQQLDDQYSSRPPVMQDSSERAALIKQGLPRDTHEFESKIIYNGHHVPVKIPTAPSPETVGDFSLVQFIHTFNTPHVSQPQPFALHPHLTTSGANTHPILVLINAILTEKRIIFLGHNRPSGEVAEAVLAACALASGGVLRGFTRHAFPYTDLTKIDELLKVPGFIAGVTNPAFSYHPEWWDLLVDIPTGRMKISASIEAAPLTEGSTYFQHHLANLPKDNNPDPSGDNTFMDDIIRSIDSRQGESVIRSKFRSYVTKFTRMAAAFEETVYGASSLLILPPTEADIPQVNGASRVSATGAKSLKGHGYIWPNEEAKSRELAAMAAKIEGWRNTRSYYAFISDLALRSRDLIPPIHSLTTRDATGPKVAKPYIDIYHCLAKLRTLRLLPSEASPIFLALEAYCNDYNSILELLEQTPLSEAGLFHVSLGLWHEDAKVREATAALLERIKNHDVGRFFFARLGGFVNTGFARIQADRNARLAASEQS